MTQSHKPIRLAAQHLDQAVQVMARAFQNDPMLKYLVPDDARRFRLLPSFFSMVVHYCSRYGEAYTTPTLEVSRAGFPQESSLPLAE